MLLACIFLLGIGTTFLQVAGNPIMRDVSAEGGYSRNLAFAQGIKGIGSTASTYLVTAVASIAFFKSMGWRGAFPLFFVLMALAFVGGVAVKVKKPRPTCRPASGRAWACWAAHFPPGGARHLSLCRRGGLHGHVPFSRA